MVTAEAVKVGAEATARLKSLEEAKIKVINDDRTTYNVPVA